MKGMILSAGYGSRMGDLTKDTPKCLVRMAGKPLVEYVLDRFREIGVTEVILNLFYLPDTVRKHFEEHPYRGIEISYAQEPYLLGTGGGVREVQSFFAGSDAFFVHNCDVWSDIDLAALATDHKSSGAIATLCVQHRTTTRLLLGDRQGRLKGWEDQRRGKQTLAPNVKREDLTPVGFAGIQMLSSQFYHYLNRRTGEASIIDSYLDAAVEGAQVRLHSVDDSTWFDIGTPERLAACQRHLTDIAG